MLLKGHHPPPPTQDQARMQTADWELFTRTDSASDGGISFEDLVSSSERDHWDRNHYRGDEGGWEGVIVPRESADPEKVKCQNMTALHCLSTPRGAKHLSAQVWRRRKDSQRSLIK